MLRPRLHLLRRTIPLRRPLVPLGLHRRLATTLIADDVHIPPPSEAKRQTASFYISNVFPIAFGRWDPRPPWAIIREESMMEQLHDIALGVAGHGFRIESWEIARKDGGVFMHFSYVPPEPEAADENDAAPPDVGLGIGGVSGLPEITAKPGSPGQLFLGQFMESAKKNGGLPNWIGDWWARISYTGPGHAHSIPGHTLYSTSLKKVSTVGDEGEEVQVKGSGSGMRGVQASAGGGRVWVVKGKQWTEDMNRFASNRLRVEFDGPDVSQEMLYTLFRPYGRVADIQPPSPVPAGSLRFAVVSYSGLSPSTTAINCLHGFSTPTNTADYTLRASGQSPSTPSPLSRLRIYYERPLKAHAIRDWISAHPRIALPVIAFLIGTLSYTFFDPIRAFFVRSKLEGIWDVEKYSVVKWVRARFSLSSLGFRSQSPSSSSDAIGKDAWKDRIDAEKSVERWLSEYPSTFITITGPSGSGKASLMSRVLGKESKPTLIIDCAEIGKAKNDGALVSALADQTGYWPVFSFLSSLNGLIDLASVGLIGQKAGFATPVDQQLRQMLEIVGGALKDVSSHEREQHKSVVDHQRRSEELAAEHQRRRELIVRGGWHDGRLDCIAGNGVMSELGLGDERTTEEDLLPVASVPLIDDIAPIAGEGVPPNTLSLTSISQSPSNAVTPPPPAVSESSDIDAEAEFIRTLPIVVLKNFAQKTAKGDLWNVLAEWGASLIENRVAHVIVVTEGAPALKALTRALPSKPLNGIGLTDADEDNSMTYVTEKLSAKDRPSALSVEDKEQVKKLGGRMVDLETLVYKVRTGSTVKDAVDDIVLRNVVELRKAAFGDDEQDAKSLSWSRVQAWKIVSELAKNGEVSYAKLLQNFPFKGNEQALKAMEEHELISVSYVDGRAETVKPGKPVFRYAFQRLVDDATFRAASQVEYNASLISSAQADIKSCEQELLTLKDITTSGGDEKLGFASNFLGLGGSSAVKERAKWLLEKMGKSVDSLKGLEAENAEMMKLLNGGGAKS